MNPISEFIEIRREAKACYEDPYTLRQFAKYKYYSTTAKIKHLFNGHMWKYIAPVPFDGYFKRCTWCGHSRKITQKEYMRRS